MNLLLAIEAFLEHMQRGNYSQNSILTYKNALNELKGFFRKQNDQPIDQIFQHNTYPEIREFINQGYQNPNTKNLKLAAVSSFLRWASDNDFIATHKFQALTPFPDARDNQINTIDAKQFQACLRIADGKKSPAGKRCATALRLIFSTGIKTAEVINLKVSDFNPKNNTLFIEARNDQIPIHPDMTRALSHYVIAQRPAISKAPSLYMFPNKHGKALSRCTIARDIKTIGSKVGIKLSPQLLRLSFARFAQQAGMPSADIQFMLGHSQFQGTHSILSAFNSQPVLHVHETK